MGYLLLVANHERLREPILKGVTAQRSEDAYVTQPRQRQERDQQTFDGLG